jgi:hypothetical protein
MPDQDDPGELKKLIIRDMQLETDERALTAGTVEAFKEKLINVINLLLQSDFPRLMNAMYRLDIDEKLFRDALSGLHSPNVAARLADLVINRELEKIRTRNKYRT